MSAARASGPAGYEPTDYLAAARFLEQAAPEDCHPALYRQRRQAAAALRRMAETPDERAHRRALNGVRFLCYGLRSTK